MWGASRVECISCGLNEKVTNIHFRQTHQSNTAQHIGLLFVLFDLILAHRSKIKAAPHGVNVIRRDFRAELLYKTRFLSNTSLGQTICLVTTRVSWFTAKRSRSSE